MLVETRRKEEGERRKREREKEERSGSKKKKKKKNNKTLGCNLSWGYEKRHRCTFSFRATFPIIINGVVAHCGSRKTGMPYPRTQPRFFFRRNGN